MQCLHCYSVCTPGGNAVARKNRKALKPDEPKTTMLRVNTDLAKLIVWNAKAQGLDVADYLDPILREGSMVDAQKTRNPWNSRGVVRFRRDVSRRARMRKGVLPSRPRSA